MMMRLAFSVAVNVEPDILIIDEVLGVGDQSFFEKCLDRIMEFRRAEKTIICVSHVLPTLAALCNRAVWLDGGQVVAMGSAKEVLQEYAESPRVLAANL
jgi:ABC-type polysaccharide/polyol phosphate transport system ATPase subunit